MIDVNPTREIDLAEYGGEGMLTMGLPSFRRFTAAKNEISRMSTLTAGKETKMGGISQGDIQIISVMMYVRTAPFTPTVDGWLAYCDRLEQKDPSASYRLFDRMEATMKELESSQASPFSRSRGAETGISE